MEKELAYRKYIQREEDFSRAPYSPEVEFYTVIRAGDTKRVREMSEKPFSSRTQGWGVLSDDLLRNMKYHFVITIALVARYCIDGGMELTEAYDLSDYYIQKCDRCKEISKIDLLHNEAALTYAMKMREIRKHKICSKPVALCLDYISDNLHKKLSIADLAAHVGLSESHLSREFKKETGQTICSYIQNLKLETAKNMLLCSEYSPAEIAFILAFSDQSYFTEVFRKRYGISPGKFKRQNVGNMNLGRQKEV